MVYIYMLGWVVRCYGAGVFGSLIGHFSIRGIVVYIDLCVSVDLLSILSH